MALGILEASESHVAGTVHVKEEEQRTQELLASNPDLKLRKDKHGNAIGILVPQPSNDPNDPLNWPLWYRDVILAILCTVAVIATTSAPLLAADSVLLANRFLITYQAAADLTAYLLAGAAVGAAICVPSARVWGKRHVFLLGALLMCVASAWGGSSRNGYNHASLIWARVFQGVALAPFESLTNAVVGDLYFVHERGPRMALVNTAIFGGAFLTPVFVGMISIHIGWQWSFYLLSIFMGVGFLALLFFFPETAFLRDEALNTDITTDVIPPTNVPGSSQGSTDSNEKEVSPSTAQRVVVKQKRESYAKQLLPVNGRRSNDSFWTLLLRPFPLYLQPAVVWGCLMQGVIIGWTVMVGVVLSFIFLQPPLFFTEEQVGKLYTSAFIGSMIGLFLSGLYSELLTNWLIKRNHGIYEPEYRILLALPTLIFAALGLFGFGITASDVARYRWLVPDVFFGFIVVSMVMGAIASAQYLLDAHRDIDIEIFTNLIIFKNIFSFILAHFAYDWIFVIGTKPMFLIFGGIEVGLICLSIPMYIFGKKNRAFFHKHDILKMCKLR